jgi:hypothetical protein
MRFSAYSLEANGGFNSQKQAVYAPQSPGAGISQYKSVQVNISEYDH